MTKLQQLTKETTSQPSSESLTISYFHNSKDNDPGHLSALWGELAETLAKTERAECTLTTCKRKECSHKYGRAWSPAEYVAGSKRGKANVTALHALVLDLDDVPAEELPGVLAKLEPYRYIIHASHSDRELSRCLRVVLQLSRPVAGTDWPRFWSAAIAALDVQPVADHAASDASRIFFLPSRPKDADYYFDSNDGAVIDVDAVLSRAPVAVEVDADVDFVVPEFSGAPSSDAMETAVNALAGAWPDKGRNTCQLALSGALARAGWPVELIADFLEAVCETAEPGNGDRPKRMKSARASVAKVNAGEMVAGWPTVEEYVDPDAVKIAMDALGMGAPKFDPAFNEAMAAHALPVPTRAPTNDNMVARLGMTIGDAVLRPRPPVRRYSTGMPELDRKIGGGLTTRQLAVVMAPPGDGKSGLAVGTALTFAKRGEWSLYASTELETLELVARVAAPILNVWWKDIVDGNVSMDLVREAVSNLPIRIVGCDELPMGEDALEAVETEASAMALDQGGVPPLVILDYLQDLARGVDDQGVRGKIGDLSMRLRAMAQRLDCPLLVVSSVSRQYYGIKKATELRQADDPTVYLAAAKESGDIDYAAAVVMFLDVLPPEDGELHRKARIAVAKSRHGQTGFVGARFYGATGRWEPAVDDILGAAQRRKEREARTQDEQDDAIVRATIERAAAEGTYRTGGGWRELIPGVPHNRVNKSIARQVQPGGPFTTSRHHPTMGNRAAGNGEYVVPRGVSISEQLGCSIGQ